LCLGLLSHWLEHVADRPIGTHIFTAMERTGAVIRWSVVSLAGDHLDNSGDGTTGRKGRGGSIEAMSTDLSEANAALDRVAIP
jgi:hypothetical protein